MVSIDINPTFIWQLINFLILIWALNTVFYKPVRKILQKRFQTIAALKAEIAHNNEDCQSRQQALQMRRTATKSQGLLLWEKLKKEAQAEELAQLQEAMKANNEFLDKQRNEMQTQIAMAGDGLKQEIPQFARDIAGKILQRNFS
jgi:F-type H+-transporting ATPase subunit b